MKPKINNSLEALPRVIVKCPVDVITTSTIVNSGYKNITNETIIPNINVYDWCFFNGLLALTSKHENKKVKFADKSEEMFAIKPTSLAITESK